MNNSDLEIIVAAGMLTVCSLAMGARVLEKKRKKQRKRSCWVKRWREERKRCGNVQALLNESNLSNNLKSYLFMDEFCFGEILKYVEEDITRNDTQMRAAIPAKERLAVTLRFLSTGENFNELNENTKLSASFLRKNIIEVCESIYKNMSEKFLTFPETKEKWLEISQDFEALWQFPHCLGALDGKHIAFTPSQEEAPIFYNYKGFNSIVLMAMCDANCRFTFIDVGCNGRISDCGVLIRSDLMSVLSQGDSLFPKPAVLGNNRKLPYVIVADNAFPNMQNLITPYSKTHIQKDFVSFNARLNRARQNIERAFGVLTNHFRVLQSTIKLNSAKTVKIVQCCCVLHNYLIENSLSYKRNLSDFSTANCLNYKEEENNLNEENQHRPKQQRVETIRTSFREYFANEGNIRL